MNWTAPSLIYLAIYNPSLRSTSSSNDYDEDAEEQAHILFYTSKERAVSRDRMLRQIGLAKALVSFSEMFSVEGPLETVHSQTRRMITISPEPNFWIHACIELGKVPRMTHDKGKNKARTKGKEKGKEKEREKGKEPRDAQTYHYEDGSIHDGALREDIMRSYERFKLTHGSFSEILDTIGQEALGLQLERFWTPWAWSWSLENGHDFAQHLGLALHPYFKNLLPVLDDLQDDIPKHDLTLLLLTPTSIAPSTAYLQNNYPISLPLYLVSLIPPPRDPSINSQDDRLASSQATIKGIDDIKGQDSVSGQGGGFLNMQAMDVRKWNWGNVLTFGRNSAKTSSQGSSAAVSAPDTAVTSTAPSPRTSTDQSASQVTPNREAEIPDDKETEEGAKRVERSTDDLDADGSSIVESEVDQSALDDAISSRVSPAPSIGEISGIKGPPSAAVSFSQSHSSESGPGDDIRECDKDNKETKDEEKETIEELDAVTPKALPAFMRRTVYLQDADNPLVTSQRRVYFLPKGQWILALISSQKEHESDTQGHLNNVSRISEKFFETVEEIMQEESMKSMSDSLPSASKILQPTDTHIGSTGKYIYGRTNFHSKSGVLYEAKALQDRDPEILEVFSRGQNPQYWYMARRTRPLQPGGRYPAPSAGVSGGGSAIGLGEPNGMYMEVFRKETSLADVDNVMAGAVKNWKGVMEDVEGL